MKTIDTTQFSYVGDAAEDLVEKVTVTGETYNLKTVKLSEWFDHNPTTTEIFERMEKEGLDYCPPDAVNQVAKVLKKGDSVWLGMKPILDRYGRPGVFGVGRHDDGGRWLSARWAGPGSAWALGGRVVFRLRKSSDPLTLEKRVTELERKMSVIQIDFN